MKLSSPLLSALALAAGALLCAAPAHAVGRLLDVNVIDRDSGAQLPVYRHEGQWWIAGRPGARYAIAVRNAGGARVMGVMAVDGVNVINGETAGWDQTGYVLAGWQHAQITGWRKSDSQVAAFHFTALPNSYAARTGRPDNVGVIGVAVFREKVLPPPPPIAPMPAPLQRHEAPAAGESASASPSPQDARASARGMAAEAARADAAAPAGMESAARGKLAAPPAAPRLGTGHGARESSWVSHTQFERRSARPDEIITIRYDSHENLVALGVIPSTPRQAQRPQPFPDSAGGGYTPDPPAWR